MLKLMAILSLLFVVSSVWSACDSCGSECTSACGTRRFRACCFNYLRKKRGDGVKIHSLAQDMRESQHKSEVPVFVLLDNMSVPQQWTNNVLPIENHLYSLEDLFENRLD